jgi:hypothetical protein
MARRGVDADHLQPATLEMQAHAASAATDVEYAPPDETHRAPLVRVVPAREGRDEVPRVEGHEEPVVALDDLVRASPRESVLVSVP